MRNSTFLRRPLLSMFFVLATALAIATFLTARALAYNGEFCYGKYLAVHTFCNSNTVSHIRRAVGHGADWTLVYVQNGGVSKSGQCKSDGCTADSGYLSKDITGIGGIANIGDPCNCGGGDYYGWLYP